MPDASLPLPGDLVQAVDAYLEKHSDQGPSERLQDELISIWEKSVEESPGIHASWLAILKRLLPALKKPEYLIEWWNRVQEQVLDRLAEDKTLAAEVWANTIAVLTCDDVEGEELSQLAVRLLNIWMQSVRHASQEDNSVVYFKARLVKGSLLSYGKKRPKVRASFYVAPFSSF